MVSGRLTPQMVVRKVVRTKDNRAFVYIPLAYIKDAVWVAVRREGEKIVIEPIKIENSEER